MFLLLSGRKCTEYIEIDDDVWTSRKYSTLNISSIYSKYL